MSDNYVLDLEATRPDETVFYSRYTNLKLVRQPTIDETLVGGARRVLNPGTRYRFEQGVLRVRAGRDKMIDRDGWLAPGQEEGIERDAVEALRAHRRYNKDFWEAGREPGRPTPYEEDVLADMSKAAADLKDDVIERLLVGERETHNRQLLVRALTSALETTRAARIKLEGEVNDKAAEAAEAKAKPAKKAAE